MARDGRGERFHRGLKAVVLAIMPVRVAEGLAAACGLWSVLSPLLLWIAWSKTVFLAVLGSSILCGCISALIAMALAEEWRRVPRRKQPAEKRGGFGRPLGIRPDSGASLR